MKGVKPIVLYVNPLWRRSGVHTPFLNCWWGNPFDKTSLFSWEMFDAHSFDTSYYTLTDNIENAEMVLAPYRHNWLLRFDKNLLKEVRETAQSHNLPLLIDDSSDVERPVVGENVFTIRYGGYRFLKERGRIQIPVAADDLLERTQNGVLSIRKKNNGTPVIGFAAWTKITLSQRLKTFIKELPLRLRSLIDARYKACRKGVLWREKVIKILSKSELVVLKLHERRSFSANPKTAEGDMRKLQMEMVDVILDSDYALDVRGDANNSARLFEILSLGRIPVIVDTERNFPFKDKVDYSSFALIVDHRDIYKLPEIISEFHKNISSERYEEMQQNARKAFVEYFRIDAFSRILVEELQNRIS